MKKTYIIPETLTVCLSTKQTILQTSMPEIDGEGSVDAGNVEVKEVISNKSLWDSEW